MTRVVICMITVATRMINRIAARRLTQRMISVDSLMVAYASLYRVTGDSLYRLDAVQ